MNDLFYYDRFRYNSRIIISRTDGLGDVLLTLPVAGVLKRYFPDCKITFLGRGYTQPLVERCVHIDNFLDWDVLKMKNEKERLSAIGEVGASVIIHVFPVKEIAVLAKRAKIPVRIGTSHRIYHLRSCNKLVNLGRKNSGFHEAQLNLMLLKPLGITDKFTKESIPGYYGLIKPGLSNPFQKYLDKDRFNLILHPKSKGSAREWGLNNYRRLIEILPSAHFRIFITGTEEEGKMIRNALSGSASDVTDLTGKMTLAGLIDFIGMADGIVAASTGPLHIAAAYGKYAMGIYAPMRPIYPGRWAPLGENASYFVLDKTCIACKRSGNCSCISAIQPEEIKGRVLNSLRCNSVVNRLNYL